MINITYGITGRQLRQIIADNINELEDYALGSGESEITEIETGLSVDNFFSAINDRYDELALRIANLTPGYTEVDADTEDIATVLNNNFTTFSGLADDFLADGVPFWLSIKQCTIPGKGTANILNQQDDWKLGYYTGENILYLSADCGVTWPYSIAFADGCDQIRNAWVFKNGNVFIGIRENKIFYSDDLLSTLPEITCKDTDGDDLVFHTPENASYPGAYFATFRGNSFVKDSVETYVFGNYPHHNNYGAAPIRLYRVRDDEAGCKAFYIFGQNPNETDNGTSTGGIGGNLLGDAENTTICKHYHYCNYDPYNEDLWVQTGDNTTPSEIYFFKCNYNVSADTWSITEYEMSALSGYFRACSLDFYNDGDNCIWASDSNKYVYKVTYANLTTALTNHTSKYLCSQNILGLSPYGAKMFIIGGPEVPGEVAVSVDYGENWQAVTTGYLGIIGALTSKMFSRIWNVDSNGYALIHRSVVVPLYAKESYLIKIKDKP